MFGLEYAIENDLESLGDFTDDELINEMKNRGLDFDTTTIKDFTSDELIDEVHVRNIVFDCLKGDKQHKANVLQNLIELSNKKRLGFNVDNDIEQLINDVNSFEDYV